METLEEQVSRENVLLSNAVPNPGRKWHHNSLLVGVVFGIVKPTFGNEGFGGFEVGG